MDCTPRGGRGYGRGRGSGGRGYGGFYSNNRSYSQQSSTKNQKAKKFATFDNDKPPPATFTSVKDEIVLQFKKFEQNDVATSIEKMKLVTVAVPIRKISTLANPDDKKVEQDGFNIVFQGEESEYRRKKSILDEGINSAYSIIFSDYCTKEMQGGIKQNPDFSSKIYNDPIKLLKAIKILMHSPKRAQYPQIGWMDTLNRFLNTKQEHNESLSDNYARFKQEYDAIKSVFGTKIFEAASEKLDEYTSTTSTIKQDAIKKGSFDAFASVILVRNSDQNKYGTLLDTRTTVLALGSNVFPKTKEKALDALSNYSFDPGYVEYKQKKERPTRSDTSGGNQNSFAQKPKENLICHCCGKKGHAAPDCTLREKIPRENWYIRRLSTSTSRTNNYDEDDKKTAAGRGKKGWSGFQREAERCFNIGDMNSCFHDDLKDVIILDTGSTIGATFMNPKLLSNIKSTSKPLEMITNAGTKKMSKTGIIEGFGNAWFDLTQVANIFGFEKLEDQCRITYNSSVVKAIHVHTNNGIVKFTRNKDGLYVYRPSKTI
jgi:hypothetical protein